MFVAFLIDLLSLEMSLDWRLQMLEAKQLATKTFLKQSLALTRSQTTSRLIDLEQLERTSIAGHYSTVVVAAKA